jgi:ParB-like chromosome segregation protein Spo0J
MEITIVENLQRADLNPMEQARAYERLSREFHMTQEQMATAHRQRSGNGGKLPAPAAAASDRTVPR